MQQTTLAASLVTLPWPSPFSLVNMTTWVQLNCQLLSARLVGANLCLGICDRHTVHAQEQRIALCKRWTINQSNRYVCLFIMVNMAEMIMIMLHVALCSVVKFRWRPCYTLCVCVHVCVCVCMHVCAAFVRCFIVYCNRIRIYTRLTSTFFINSYCSGAFNNNNNVHLSCAHQCPECLHNTYY